MIIRNEEERDWAVVYALNESAFRGSTEAKLVEVLRQQVSPIISLVAEIQEKVIGHIMFSPITLLKHPGLELMGLAPMAVAPEHQRKGVGSALVRVGLEKCREIGSGAVFVLGHPEYYPRFGFLPSVQFGVSSEYDVPEEVFLARELQQGYLKNLSGTVRYHKAFSSCEPAE